jgi:hypothetical protein
MLLMFHFEHLIKSAFSSLDIHNNSNPFRTGKSHRHREPRDLLFKNAEGTKRATHLRSQILPDFKNTGLGKVQVVLKRGKGPRTLTPAHLCRVNRAIRIEYMIDKMIWFRFGSGRGEMNRWRNPSPQRVRLLRSIFFVSTIEQIDDAATIETNHNMYGEIYPV